MGFLFMVFANGLKVAEFALASDAQGWAEWRSSQDSGTSYCVARKGKGGATRIGEWLDGKRTVTPFVSEVADA